MTDSSPKAITKDIASLIAAILGRLSSPMGLTVAFMILALFFLVANHQVIGASFELVIAYLGMFVLMLGWAFFRKVPLERLDWRATDIIKGKFDKKPQSIHWAFIIAFIAFLATVALCIMQFHPVKADMAPGMAMQTAWQQLFIISLSEAVMFQGMFPLIVEWELLRRENTREKAAGVSGASYSRPSPAAMLLTVIIVGQGMFAVTHYTAYGGSWTSILFAFMLGTIWYIMGRYLGIQSAWLSHFGWNCIALALIGIPPAASLLLNMFGA